MLWTPQDGFSLLEKHLDRLLDSADYFDFPVPRKVLEEHFHKIGLTFTSPQKIRLLLNRAGVVTTSALPFQSSPNPIHAHLAKRPVDSMDVFLFHKTTQREVFEAARADFPDCDDVLLYNEHGEITEFTIGNLVADLNGQLFTPPLDSGVLPGVFRAHLLETNQIIEQIIPIHELRHSTRIFRVNSVRRWESVEMRWE
jgi:para-aminobenzoate synthetase/4-amino-4-deoxychorismate lyase